jgi:hypothetical protein
MAQTPHLVAYRHHGARAASLGREAVLGLVAMKEALEDPARLLFDI